MAEARSSHAPPPCRRGALFGVLCALFFGSQAGQADGAKPVASSTTRPVDVPTDGTAAAAPSLSLKRAVLDNGLRLVFVVDHAAPQVAVCSTYAAGSGESDALPGAAAVVHRMLREGGRSTSGADYSRKVEARGASIVNTLTAEYARFCTLVPKHEIELALWLEAGRMTEYAFNQVNFDKRVQELKGEYLDAVQGSISARGLRRLTEIAFQNDGSYERVTPPNPSDLDSLGLGDARGFHQQFYRPDNAVLSVAGDFDAFEVLDLIKRHLGSQVSSTRVESNPRGGGVRQTSPRLSVLIDPAASSAAAYYGWVIPDPKHPEHGALRIANTLLGDGEASLLYEQLVRKRHLASDVEAFTAGHSGPDLFAVRVQANGKARLDLIERVLNEVLTGLSHGYFLRGEGLETAKRRLMHRRLEQLSSNLGKAQYVGAAELRGGDADPVKAEFERLEKVTASEVSQAVRNQLVLARRTSIEIYPDDWHDPNQAAMPKYHVISSGETLTSIAKRYGATVEAIAKMNGIDDKRPIFPGQKLRVPRGGATQSKKKSGKKEAIAYQVKKGDSLSSIAARHDISVAALLRANRIDPKKPLQIGQRLAIPVPP